MTDSFVTSGHDRSVPVSAAMPDVQGSLDERNIAINQVGVKGVRYPITLVDPATGGEQHTVAMVNMYVGLPADQKGTHMSRFLEVLNAHHRSIRSDDVMAMCREMKKRLGADEAHLELTFPYFIDKAAPVTGQVGKLDVEVTFTCTSGATDDFVLGVKVPATSLCPCSKEISEYGAHNQRCEMLVEVRVAEGEVMWVEDVVAVAERAASTQVFSVLKRPDEKYVTEAAYDNPKFVEDTVRDLALGLEAEERVVWYRVNSENFESIHNHNAFACIERDKRG
ncbi:GTP cyclohydrolase FolE2 [Mucisphaera sp.]|uniref:GTP cyclohydrolase FolE2 n=1 Tax=Mucisphaera sp. TaxID=2913024 RepID=UPI003D15169C